MCGSAERAHPEEHSSRVSRSAARACPEARRVLASIRAVNSFRLGINYWPIKSAMYWWRRFDRAEIEADFSRIREAGFDSVRVFLLWEDFQPDPGAVSQHSLTHLVDVADLASKADLQIVI